MKLTYGNKNYDAMFDGGFGGFFEPKVNGFERIKRDMSIQMALDVESIFVPNIERLKRGNNYIFNMPYWKILKKYKDHIISDMYALYAFGLVNSLVSYTESNINLQMSKKKSEPIVLLNTKEANFRSTSERGYEVIFKNEDCPFIEVSGFKFKNPINIISSLVHQYESNGPTIHYKSVVGDPNDRFFSEKMTSKVISEVFENLGYKTKYKNGRIDVL